MTDRDIFIAALDHAEAAERDAWLDQACAGDADRRRRVDVLLRAHDQASKFLADPAAAQLQPAADNPTRTANSADETTPATAIDLHALLAPTDKPGQLGTLDHYEVLEVVGAGGMGVVLKAFDPKLHRLVAIKLMSPHLAAHGSARKRFEREARAVAAVKNEHVVAIHHVGNDGPTPYLVMEFVGGISLQDRLERHGPLDVKEILRIGLQTARGLAAAHAQGIVHRDIKPANILLENGVERVKITDFGLARAADDANLTRSGVITGTPNYMSPEQSAGVPVDARSDLFSLGSVLYAQCTGHPPFRAETPLAVLRRVADDAPRPVREINPDIPGWLDAIVRKLLAKDPADRFQTATEVADLLGQHLAHLQQPAMVALPAPVVVPGEPVREERAWGEPPAAPVARADAPASSPPAGPAGFAWLVVIALVVVPALLFWTHESFWDGYFQPGYVAPVYMIVSSGLLLAVLWWCRRQSEPRWYRRVLALAMSAVVGGTLIGLLVSWGEGSYLDKLGGASTWHNAGIGAASALVIVSAFIRAARWLTAKRRAELGARPERRGSPLDGRSAFAVGLGFFTLVVGLMAAMFIGSLTEPKEDRMRALRWVLSVAGTVAVLSFGPGVFVARRWWRKRRPEDRRADRRAAMFAGAGLGMTLMSILLVIVRMPELREAVFGGGADPRLTIHWNPQHVDRVTVERGHSILQEHAGGHGAADLTLPPATYTVRGFRNGREIYQELVTLDLNKRHAISMFDRPPAGSDYGLLRIICNDLSVVVTLRGAEQLITLNDPGDVSEVSQPLRLKHTYSLRITRGKEELHSENVRLDGDAVRIFIPRIVLAEKAVTLKPKPESGPFVSWRMHFSPDRSLIASEGFSGAGITVFDAATGEERYRIDRPEGHNTAVAFTPNSQFLSYVGPGDDGKEPVVRFVNARTGQPTGEQLKPKSQVLMNARALAISSDGKRLGVSSAHTFGPDSRFRSRIHRWENPDQRQQPLELSPLEWEEGTIEAMRFTPDGSEVRAVSDAATVSSWNWDKPDQRSAYAVAADRPGGAPGLLAGGGPDLRPFRLAVCGPAEAVCGPDRAGGPVLLFSRPASGRRELRNADWPGASVFGCVALSADGRLGAAGNCGWPNGAWNDRPAIRIWDTDFASQRAILLGHTDWVLDVAFDKDGTGLVSTGKDGTVRYWKLP